MCDFLFIYFFIITLNSSFFLIPWYYVCPSSHWSSDVLIRMSGRYTYFRKVFFCAFFSSFFSQLVKLLELVWYRVMFVTFIWFMCAVTRSMRGCISMKTCCELTFPASSIYLRVPWPSTWASTPRYLSICNHLDLARLILIMCQDSSHCLFLVTFLAGTGFVIPRRACFLYRLNFHRPCLLLNLLI